MKARARVLDPRGAFLQKWNKIFVISCLVSVSVDSLFFYAPAIDGDNSCLYLDDNLQKIASILRSLTDAFYLLRVIFQFRTGFMDLQVVKHYPEQYLVIFSDPRNMQRAVRQRYIVSSGRTYNFAPWDETREAVDDHMEFRAYVRIEGIPLHAWGMEVAEKVLGKECAIHYVEEHTRRKERTRTFDLWAWCSDPCKIPTEVWLTITDPDAEQPPVDNPQAPVHRDPPTDIKHGLTYRILPHVATVEDLSFIRGNGGPGGPPNRKRRRNFDWRYGVPDILGEARGRQHEGRGRDGHGHHRRDDGDDDRRGHHRRHRSASAWGRITRCRTGAADCYSSNFRGAGGSFHAGGSHRSRAWMPEPMKLVYKVKVTPTPLPNNKSKKRVTFADPLFSFCEDPLSQLDVNWDKEGAETKAVKKAPAHADPTGQKEKNKENGLNMMLVKVHNSAASNTNHFVKPINMVQMEALQVLVEHGTKLEKAGKNKGAARQMEVA